MPIYCLLQNVGAPAIRMDDVVSWKSRGISNVKQTV
jgi:hypothetical protein